MGTISKSKSPVAKSHSTQSGAKSGGSKNNKKAYENPFDKFANARKKHEVLNRRVKGEDRNVGRAKEKAIDERKKKLLHEMLNANKTNAFVDKRFGESDANLSLEEKMFMRFQQEKIKKTRNKSIFNLDSGDTEVLTHRGAILSAGNMKSNEVDDDDSDDDRIGKEMVENLHFGGGLVASSGRGGGGGGGESEFRKNRMDSLQEMVMKSKLHKLEKKEAKDAQEQETDDMDLAYDALVKASLLDFKPKKRDRSEDEETRDANDEFADYDMAFRTMAFESKVKPSDRIKSAEELATEAKKRLEDLEKARVKRMSRRDDKEEVSVSKDKSKRAVTDDDIGDGEQEFAGYKSKKDFLLHHDFSAKGRAARDGEEDGEDGEEGEGSEDEDADDEDGDGEDEDDDGEDEDDEGTEEEQGSEGDEGSSADEGRGRASKEHNSLHHKWIQRRREHITKELSSSAVNPLMPHNIECPVSLTEFDELVEEFVLTDEDMLALIDRIMGWNSINLPGKEGISNRHRMHNFLDILIKHLTRVGDSCYDPAHGNAENLALIDRLSLGVYTLSQDLGESCVLLWGKLIKQLETQLQKKLRDYTVETEHVRCCWPSVGRLLLLRLVAHVFPVTDYQHTIVSSASLLLCECLSQCPVASAADLSSGLYVCGLLLEFNAQAQRHVPEVITFLRSVVQCFRVRPSDMQATFNIAFMSDFRPKIAETSASKLSLKWLHSTSSGEFPSEFVGSCLSVLQKMLGTVCDKYTNNVASHEILTPLLEALRALRPQDAPAFPARFLSEHLHLLERIIPIVTTSRVALRWRPPVKVIIGSKAPKFEINYSMKKDKDEDRDKAKLKQLGRQLKRETKSTMREIRRDSDFIDQERYRVDTEKKQSLRDERGKNFAWMETEQATINQQVRMGQGLMKGGGSGIIKKARVGR